MYAYALRDKGVGIAKCRSGIKLSLSGGTDEIALEDGNMQRLKRGTEYLYLSILLKKNFLMRKSPTIGLHLSLTHPFVTDFCVKSAVPLRTYSSTNRMPVSL